MSTLSQINYVHVLVITVIGFLLGWLWYSVLFGKIWMTEMKITEEMRAEGKSSMGPLMAKAFFYTFVSTVGLAMVLHLHPVPSWDKGAELGAAIGLLIVGARFLNSGVWEKKSCKLLTINVGHEVVLFALQGALLTFWP